MAKKKEMLNNLNITVVALVALVAIVGVTAIVLNGKTKAADLVSSDQNLAGDARYSEIERPHFITEGMGSGTDCKGIAEDCSKSADCCSQLCRNGACA